MLDSKHFKLGQTPHHNDYSDYTPRKVLRVRKPTSNVLMAEFSSPPPSDVCINRSLTAAILASFLFFIKRLSSTFVWCCRECKREANSVFVCRK